MSARYALLALAHPRAGWFREVARWASSASIPVDYTVTVSPQQAIVHLEGDRPYSALMVDASVSGVDRELISAAGSRGTRTIVVDDGSGRHDWRALGASAVLPSLFDRASLVSLLEAHALPVDELTAVPHTLAPRPVDPSAHGLLVAVTGPGGTGTSTVARALAQGLAQRRPGDVLLADLALHADQAVLHGTGDVVPALQELVEAHRAGSPDGDAVRDHTFEGERVGYRLLLGLRRHHDWAALRPNATAAAIASLRRAFPVVVADVEPDVEGEALTGSLDVEERNHLARTATAQAHLVLVTGSPTTQGVHRMLGAIRGLRDHGVRAEAIQPVLTRVPRRPARRASLVAAIHELSTLESTAAPVPPPLFVVHRNDVEQCVRDGEPLPTALAEPLARDVGALLAQLEQSGEPPAQPEPERLRPGSLGGWWLDGEAVGA